MPKPKITKSDLGRMGRESNRRSARGSGRPFTAGQGNCPGNKLIRRKGYRL